jgi:NADH dehydrogenase (ubiquinone) 1 alpha subcomplex subunit 9
MYGQEDRFLQYYNNIWRRRGKWMPLYRKGNETVKQPVYVADVAAGIVEVPFFTSSFFFFKLNL